MHTSTFQYKCNFSHVIQLVGTAALLLCVLALGDRKNSSIADGLQPVLVGGVVLVIGISMGSNSGYAINPARDIGPRLFTYFAGWGVDVFKLVVLQFKPHNFHLVASHLLYVTGLSLQGWRWLVVGAYSDSLCWRAAGNADL